jgi:hypothetical protein
LPRQGDRIVGYWPAYRRAYWPVWASSTPCRARNRIGAACAHALTMRRRGYHSTSCLWTGEKAAKGVYGRPWIHNLAAICLVEKRNWHEAHVHPCRTAGGPG